ALPELVCTLFDLRLKIRTHHVRCSHHVRFSSEILHTIMCMAPTGVNHGRRTGDGVTPPVPRRSAVAPALEQTRPGGVLPTGVCAACLRSPAHLSPGRHGHWRQQTYRHSRTMACRAVATGEG